MSVRRTLFKKIGRGFALEPIIPENDKFLCHLTNKKCPMINQIKHWTRIYVFWKWAIISWLWVLRPSQITPWHSYKFCNSGFIVFECSKYPQIYIYCLIFMRWVVIGITFILYHVWLLKGINARINSSIENQGQRRNQLFHEFHVPDWLIQDSKILY